MTLFSIAALLIGVLAVALGPFGLALVISVVVLAAAGATALMF